MTDHGFQAVETYCGPGFASVYFRLPDGSTGYIELADPGEGFPTVYVTTGQRVSLQTLLDYPDGSGLGCGPAFDRDHVYALAQHLLHLLGAMEWTAHEKLRAIRQHHFGLLAWEARTRPDP